MNIETTILTILALTLIFCMMVMGCIILYPVQEPTENLITIDENAFCNHISNPLFYIKWVIK